MRCKHLPLPFPGRGQPLRNTFCRCQFITPFKTCSAPYRVFRQHVRATHLPSARSTKKSYLKAFLCATPHLSGSAVKGVFPIYRELSASR